MNYLGNMKYETSNGLVLTQEDIQEILEVVSEKYYENFDLTSTNNYLKNEISYLEDKIIELELELEERD